MTDMIVTKAVFNGGIARALFLKGHTLVDFAQNRANRSKTVFYFQVTDTFLADLDALRTELIDRRHAAVEGVETAVVR